MIISFEGYDGLGKTTQCKLYSKYLKHNSIIHETVKFPFINKSRNGKYLEEYLNNNFQLPKKHLHSMMAYSFYQYMYDHPYHDVKTMLMDRYIHSCMAYGMADGLSYTYMRSLINKYIPEPDHVIYFMTDKYESPRHMKVHEAYLYIAEHSNSLWQYINIGSLTANQVHKVIEILMREIIHMHITGVTQSKSFKLKSIL